MMLTTKGRYAVMAILEIASVEEVQPISLSTISAKQNIPLNYLEQIFNKLKKSGLVIAIKGPGGGYLINTELDKLTIANIIDAVEENIEMTRCSLKSPAGCNLPDVKCKTHNLWQGLSEHIRSYFSAISVADLVSEL